MNGEGDAQVAALHISRRGAWVAQAAVVAALRVEWAVMQPGMGVHFCSYAMAMQALIQWGMVEDETFFPRELGWKETNEAMATRKLTLKDMNLRLAKDKGSKGEAVNA